MSMYAIGIKPLINDLKNVPSTKQVWYADDASVIGTVSSLVDCWNTLSEIGPMYGYYPKASKTVLLVKDSSFDLAHKLFDSTGITITTHGHCALGSPIGSSSFIESWCVNTVKQWSDQLDILAEIARAYPQSAYSCFTHGITSQWNYAFRTCHELHCFLAPLEATIRSSLIPALFSRDPPNDLKRDLFALPCRLGGLGIINPVLVCKSQFSSSSVITAPLVKLIVQQYDSISNSTIRDLFQPRIQPNV